MAGMLWNLPKIETNKSYYETVSCTEIPILVNIILAPLTFPIFGGQCDKERKFDYQRFQKDFQESLENSNIDRVKLLTQFDILKNLQHYNEKIINKSMKKSNQNLSTLISKYHKEYKSNIPTVKLKVKDKTALYKGEKLPYDVLVKEQSFSNIKNISSVSYQTYVDKAFPCRAQSECLANFEIAKREIETQEKSDLNSLQKKEKQKKVALIQKIQKTMKTYDVVNRKNSELLFTKPNSTMQKTFHYTITAPKTVKASQKSVTAMATVTGVDYQNIFPTYSNSNEDLKIVFNKDNKSYSLSNTTDKFLQIKSISVYYNDTIYNLSYNDDNNKYFAELSPNGVKRFYISRNIKESSYYNITKEKAQNTPIRFGFAIKYTLGEQAKNKTLYRQNTTNLYNIIKSQ
jgi:hypothetical protein